MSDSFPVPPLPKKLKRLCHFDLSWIQQFSGIGASSKGMYVIVLQINTLIFMLNVITGNEYTRCTYCADFSISNGGLSNVRSHLCGKHHQEMATACSSRSVKTFFPPQVSQGIIEAEAWWIQFVAKYNLSFQTSDHDTKLLVPCFQIPA